MAMHLETCPHPQFLQQSFRQYSSFQSYVDKVLSLRYFVNVQKVSYLSERETRDIWEVCSEEPEDGQYARVIEYALCHDTQHLAIELDHGLDVEHYYRFSDLFGSSLSCNLRSLEVGCLAIDSGFRSFGFRMLTTLKLDYCLLSFGQEEEDIDPFSNFPCLQNLAVKRGINMDTRNMHERRFKVSGLELLIVSLNSINFCHIEVFAPKLKSFYFKEHKYMSLESLGLSVPSLDHADILIYPVDDNYNEDDDENEDNNDNEWEKQRLISLFRGLRNVESLMLHSEIIKVLSDFDEFLEQQPSPFTRLKQLKLRSNYIHYKAASFCLKDLLLPNPSSNLSRCSS